MGSDDRVKVSKELAASIPKEQCVQVIAVFPESSDEESWRRLTGQQFLSGYGVGDGVYDSV